MIAGTTVKAAQASFALLIALATMTATEIPAAAQPAQQAPAAQQTQPPAAKKRPARKTAKKKAPPATKPPEGKAETAAILEQLKVVQRFLYVYGRISDGLEIADADEKRGALKGDALQKKKQSQAAVVANIAGLKPGLTKLELTLRANESYLPVARRVMNANEAVRTAERLAAAGQWDQAGRTLVGVAQLLADILAEASTSSP